MTEIREGSLHKKFEVEGVIFEIFYGYSTEEEKQHGWGPQPQYPVFTENPQYTARGFPFATAYQDCCEYYQPIKPKKEDNWCYNCKLFDQREKYIGICTCEKRREAVARSGTQESNETDDGGRRL